MSVHTMIESNIRHLSDLTAVLDYQKIQWNQITVTYKNTYTTAYCGLEAFVNGERILIYQQYEGSPFTFQSERAFFRAHSNAQEIAYTGLEQLRKKEAEEAKRREIEEKRIAEENERKRRIIEVEKQKERQLGLHGKAAEILRNLEANRIAKAPQRKSQTDEKSKDMQEKTSNESAVDMKNFFGKIQQQNSLKKILDSLDDLEDNAGFSLYSQEILEDETIELTLRG